MLCENSKQERKRTFNMFKRTFERTFKQRTKVRSFYSYWFEVICEIPEGSTLGPLLFNIFINDVFVIQKSNICNFADDNTW